MKMNVLDRPKALIDSIEGCWRNVEFLISRGADVNTRDNRGRTALMWAIDMGRKDIVSLLLSRGADVNAKDNEGISALRFAEMCGEWDIAVQLRMEGAKSA